MFVQRRVHTRYINVYLYTHREHWNHYRLFKVLYYYTTITQVRLGELQLIKKAFSKYSMILIINVMSKMVSAKNLIIMTLKKK